MQISSTSHKIKQSIGSNQKKCSLYDTIASHRIGITNNQSSTLGKDTKVAKKQNKIKWTNNIELLLHRLQLNVIQICNMFMICK